MASSPGRVVSVLTPTPLVVDDAEQEESETGEALPVGAPSAAGAAGASTSAPTSPISFAGATLARLRTRRPRKTDAAVPNAAPTAPLFVATDAIVMAEENKIRQVITNLMGNAMRFTSPDSPIELEVAVDCEAQRASIAVIDHGDGIPPQIREKIFQRFWRADSSRARETGGSGLGLAIVAAIVASHNGTVDVVETPGGGATFRVSLPLATAPQAPQLLDAPNP
jgi:two-component system OmpR family sensor kinase